MKMNQSSFGRVTAVPGLPSRVGLSPRPRQEHGPPLNSPPRGFAPPPTPSPTSHAEAATQVLPSSVLLEVNRRHGHVNLAITMPPQQADASRDWAWVGGRGVGARCWGGGVVWVWWKPEVVAGE